MSSENLHAPRERLSQETLNLHSAIVSLMEERAACAPARLRHQRRLSPEAGLPLIDIG
jgi:hypothetical protein